MRRHHQPPRNFVGNFRAVIAAHNVQTKIDSRGASRRSQNIPFVDIQHIRLDANLGKTRDQAFGVTPVRRSSLAVEQTRGGEHEDAGANGDQPRALGMRQSKRAYQGLRRRFIGVPPSGDDDGPGVLQRAQTPPRLDANAAAGADRAAFQRANFEVIPWDAEILPAQAKKLDHDSKLEGTEAVISKHRYAPWVPGGHGRILAHIGISAYRREPPVRA